MWSHDLKLQYTRPRKEHSEMMTSLSSHRNPSLLKSYDSHVLYKRFPEELSKKMISLLNLKILMFCT